jgi:hypothetical protein
MRHEGRSGSFTAKTSPGWFFLGILNLVRPRLHPWLDFVFSTLTHNQPTRHYLLGQKGESLGDISKVHCALVWLFHQPRTERDWGIPHDHLGAYRACRLSP